VSKCTAKSSRARVDIEAMVRQVQTCHRPTPPSPARFASGWPANHIAGLTHSSSLTACSLERRSATRRPGSESPTDPHIPPWCGPKTTVRRNAPTCEVPSSCRSGEGATLGPLTWPGPSRRRVRALSRIESPARLPFPASSGLERPPFDEKLDPTRCRLRTTPRRGCTMTADPVRAAATQLRTRRSETNHRWTVRRAVEWPEDHLPTLRSDPPSVTFELPETSSAPATDPARTSATRRPRTSSRSESLANCFPSTPLANREANLQQRRVPVCEPSPSNHPWDGCVATDPARTAVTRQNRSERAHRSRCDHNRRCRQPRTREASVPGVVGVHNLSSSWPPTPDPKA
jgi:hypothetical protein